MRQPWSENRPREAQVPVTLEEEAGTRLLSSTTANLRPTEIGRQRVIYRAKHDEYEAYGIH
jgi:hypothetical protein